MVLAVLRNPLKKGVLALKIFHGRIKNFPRCLAAPLGTANNEPMCGPGERVHPMHGLCHTRIYLAQRGSLLPRASAYPLRHYDRWHIQHFQKMISCSFRSKNSAEGLISITTTVSFWNFSGYLSCFMVTIYNYLFFFFCWFPNKT